MGDAHRCTPDTPCDEGEGDADRDEDCLRGLVVEENTGARYGLDQ